VRGLGHAAFRRESLLNTPLFAGFPGFVSKLWLADDDLGRYRGPYEWDDPLLAENYARALWRVLDRDAGRLEDLAPGRFVTVHRLASVPGQGATVVRPDGYIGFRGRIAGAGQVAAWLARVSAGLGR
jgi:hypothetical protein